MRAFEDFAQMKLPEPYAEFLLATNGCVPSELTATYRLRKPLAVGTEFQVKEFFTLGEKVPGIRSLYEILESHVTVVPIQAVPVAEDMEGNLICLDRESGAVSYTILKTKDRLAIFSNVDLEEDFSKFLDALSPGKKEGVDVTQSSKPKRKRGGFMNWLGRLSLAANPLSFLTPTREEREATRSPQAVVCEIRGVVGVGGFTGAMDRSGSGGGLWMCGFQLVAWLRVGGEIQRRGLMVRKALPEFQMSFLTDKIVPFSVVRLRICLVAEDDSGEGNAVLLRFKGGDDRDDELSAISAELRGKTTFFDPQFGNFGRDASGDYVARTTWGGIRTSLKVQPDSKGDLTLALEQARTLWAQQPAWQATFLAYAESNLDDMCRDELFGYPDGTDLEAESDDLVVPGLISVNSKGEILVCCDIPRHPRGLLFVIEATLDGGILSGSIM